MCMNASEYEYFYEMENNETFCENDTSSVFPGGSMVLPVLYYMLFCIGLLGNCTVLWVLLRHIKLRTMTDVFLLNLVLSDLLMAVTLPVWAHTSQNLVSCKLITGVYQLGFYSGTLFVTLMSVDRYLAIVHAVAAMRARTLCYGIVASIIIWVISIIMAVPQVVFASLELDENNDCQPHYPDETLDFWKKQRNFSENTVGLFVCLPIMIFCYVKILVVLSRCRNSKKNKAVKLIFTVVFVFVVCWVPYNIVVFLQTLQLFGILNTCNSSNNISWAMSIAEIVALSHCCINPVIYAFMGEKFRKSLNRALVKHFHLKPFPSTLSQKDTDNETSNTAVKSEN
ncbi:C-C chemokine receptor type 5 isoform X2 [Cololabis saira]|uniref:C-C chemokine receptor type 5 isoform X2 n=1 Tax=Cololabis saira TaxID=129043 RepID=UPI002AD37290|nr:C-C chemokine receptor type 5 isoform X2 [Cololabis saira]